MWKYLTHDIAIDLGTANTLVVVKGEGVIINEPSVVAINSATKEVLAVGYQARKMLGRTPASVIAVRPLRDGVIYDFDTTEAMIRYFIQKAHELYPKFFKIPKPRVVIGVPSTITEVEMNAVIDAAKLAGARKVYIVEEAVAAAIGSGLEIENAQGCMVVDIGGGTTDIAILSLGGIVIDESVKIAGDEMDREIVNYAKHKYNLLISEKMAEEVKIQIGQVSNIKEVKKVSLKGRDLVSGLPKTLTISNIEVKEALEKVLEEISESITAAIEKAPPEILSDMMENGVMVTGGGAMIGGIDKFLEEKLHLPIRIAASPLLAVVDGLSLLLDNIELLEKLHVKETKFV